MRSTEVGALLTVRDLAARLRVARSTAYSLLWEGKLPYVKVGRRVLVLAEDLQRFIEAHRVEPTLGN